MNESIREREFVNISAQIEVALRDEFKQLAEDRERSFSAELRLAMREYLERHGQQELTL